MTRVDYGVYFDDEVDETRPIKKRGWSDDAGYIDSGAKRSRLNDIGSTYTHTKRRSVANEYNEPVIVIDPIKPSIDEYDESIFVTPKPLPKSHPKEVFEDVEEDERLYSDSNASVWYEFNQHVYAPGIDESSSIRDKELVSASKIKNYLLKDPIIDWLDLYYYDKMIKTHDECVPPHIQLANRKSKEREFNNAKNKINILFEMGNRFEDEVIKAITIKYHSKVKMIMKSSSELSQERFKDTVQAMKDGVPIIVQAPLYNYSNMTFGAADLIVRSDYINTLCNSVMLSAEEENHKAPLLNGNYHYRIIDIKWTTMTLCANGKTIRNSDRFPAYKGQLAIYNAALGLVQGYTPNIAYILAKKWKYEAKSVQYEGFNCFDLLGEIDYNGFDQDYLDISVKAIQWIRNVRYNGHKWNTDYPPTVDELYPNMNNKYDTPFHHVKAEIAEKNKELTDIYMVGVKNRQIAHKKGIFQWSDSRCNAKALGINGAKVGPLVDAVLKINRDETGKKIDPVKIKNNEFNWQNSSEIDFFIDFETINGAFYHQEIDLYDAKEDNGVIFMIGVGYKENGVWLYRSFSMASFNQIEERRIVQDFIEFIDDRVKLYMIKNKIYNRGKVKPSLFHWGHAERTIFRATNTRHGNIWSNWIHTVQFIDFCDIVKKEPVVIKGAKNFGLKDVAKAMRKHGFIMSSWSKDGPSDGLSAMFEAAEYYRFMDRYTKMTKDDQIKNHDNYSEHIHNFLNITKYNEVDCKAMMEIIDYLRVNHC